MNTILSMPVGVIEVAICFPGLFGKTEEKLIHCVISGDDPESMLSDHLRLWCEKHSITGKVNYRYEGNVYWSSEVIPVGTGSCYLNGDDLSEPSCELFIGAGDDPAEEDLPF